MRPAPRTRLRPGWYLLAALLVYALIATLQWRATAAELREVRMQEAGAEATLPGAGAEAATALGEDEEPGQAGSAAASAAASPAASAAASPAAAPAAVPRAGEIAGLWFPIAGARLPDDDDHLPGAPRPYRAGVAEGFSFWQVSNNVPIAYGTAAVAAAAGEVIRADHAYVELDAGSWETLLARVADGASDEDLDRLRGRQVWLRLDDGRVLRYGHLASLRSGLAVGQRVSRGWVIGRVGNSGTPDAVAGRTSNARLHFEVRADDDAYFGHGLSPDEVRLAATSLFTGP